MMYGVNGGTNKLLTFLRPQSARWVPRVELVAYPDRSASVDRRRGQRAGVVELEVDLLHGRRAAAEQGREQREQKEEAVDMGIG